MLCSRSVPVFASVSPWLFHVHWPVARTAVIANPQSIDQVTRRLVAVLDEPAPGIEDVAFAVLADTAGIARPLLGGRDQRRRRARLAALRQGPVGSNAAQVLHDGCKAITELSRLAAADPRSIDHQIGLTRGGRTAAKFFGSSAT
jgi:hypothetical protein